MIRTLVLTAALAFAGAAAAQDPHAGHTMQARSQRLNQASPPFLPTVR